MHMTWPADLVVSTSSTNKRHAQCLSRQFSFLSNTVGKRLCPHKWKQIIGFVWFCLVNKKTSPQAKHCPFPLEWDCLPSGHVQMDWTEPAGACWKSSGGQHHAMKDERSLKCHTDAQRLIETFALFCVFCTWNSSQDLMRDLEAWSMELARHCPEASSWLYLLLAYLRIPHWLIQVKLFFWKFQRLWTWSLRSPSPEGLESVLWHLGAVLVRKWKGIHQGSVSCAALKQSLCKGKQKIGSDWKDLESEHLLLRCASRPTWLSKVWSKLSPLSCMASAASLHTRESQLGRRKHNHWSPKYWSTKEYERFWLLDFFPKMYRKATCFPYNALSHALSHAVFSCDMSKAQHILQ